MPKSIRFEFNHDAFQHVLNAPEVKARIRRMGDAVAQAAGEGFEVQEYTANYGGSPRPMVVVRADSIEAKRAEATDKTLTRALDAARGA